MSNLLRRLHQIRGLWRIAKSLEIPPAALRSTVAVTVDGYGPGPEGGSRRGSLLLSSIPGLRGRIKIAVGANLPIAPARCVSLKGDILVTGRSSPLRETTSAAYDVSHHSIAEVAAVDCPTQPFPKQHR